MPLTVPCECGKKLRAPERLAGTRVKCPHCGAVMTVPGQASPPTDPPSTPPSLAGRTRGTSLSRAIEDDGDTTPNLDLRKVRLAALVVLLLIVGGGGYVGLRIWTAPSPIKSQGAANSVRRAAQDPLSGAAAEDNEREGGYLDVLSSVKQRGHTVVTGSNMRQVLMAIKVFDLSNGRPPRSLDELEGSSPGIGRLLTDPQTGAPLYIYRKPARNAPGDTEVLFQAKDGEPDPQGMVGRLDGQVVQPPPSPGG